MKRLKVCDARASLAQSGLDDNKEVENSGDEEVLYLSLVEAMFLLGDPITALSVVDISGVR